jgi:hypothetical protein
MLGGVRHVQLVGPPSNLEVVGRAEMYEFGGGWSGSSCDC